MFTTHTASTGTVTRWAESFSVAIRRGRCCCNASTSAKDKWEVVIFLMELPVECQTNNDPFKCYNHSVVQSSAKKSIKMRRSVAFSFLWSKFHLWAEMSVTLEVSDSLSFRLSLFSNFNRLFEIFWIDFIIPVMITGIQMGFSFCLTLETSLYKNHLSYTLWTNFSYAIWMICIADWKKSLDYSQ